MRVAKDRIDPVAWSHQHGLSRKTEKQNWAHHFIITERNGQQSSFALPRERWATFLREMWSTTIGQANQGVGLMTQALQHLRAMGVVSSSPFHFTCLVESFAKLGRPVEGLKKLREAEELIETTDERSHEAEVHRLEGDLLRALGDQSAAKQSYSRALAVANHQNAKAVELRAATSMARLWRDQGKWDEARELLAPVYTWFTEGFDTLDLKEAKALLDELAA
jgi:predicted ATPase